jgi:hypothetical protein
MEEAEMKFLNSWLLCGTVAFLNFASSILAQPAQPGPGPVAGVTITGTVGSVYGSIHHGPGPSQLLAQRGLRAIARHELSVH